MSRQDAPFNMLQVASPSNPAAGYTKLFFKTGDVLYWRNSSGVERLVEQGFPFVFSYTGTLATLTGVHRIYNDTGATLTIKSVRASVGTAPTGAAIICDVRVDGTTIFSGGTGRPQIAISGNTNKTTGMSTTTIADGSYFTADISQVGSTIPGANLTVQILC